MYKIAHNTAGLTATIPEHVAHAQSDVLHFLGYTDAEGKRNPGLLDQKRGSIVVIRCAEQLDKTLAQIISVTANARGITVILTFSSDHGSHILRLK